MVGHNNIGAIAVVMPVAIRLARKHGYSPSQILMPIAFGSLLGGLVTMIGTPPNIIIASFRTETGAPPFGMFDFTPVGVGSARWRRCRHPVGGNRVPAARRTLI